MNENVEISKAKWNIKEEWFNAFAIGLMFLLALVHYIFFFRNSDNLGYVLNLILAIVMVYLFSTKYYCFPAILILFGNNSLENIFFGKIQFVYLGFVMMLIIFLIKYFTQKYTVTFETIFAAAVFVAMMISYCFFEEKDVLREAALNIAYFFIFLVIINDFRVNKKSNEQIFIAIVLSVFTSNIQSVFFGGIPYFAEGSLVRYGVMGAATGDPNFAGLYMLIGFFSLLCYCPSVRWYFKLPMLSCMVISIYKTASATTMGVLLLLLFAFIIITPKIKGWIKIIFVAILGVLVVLFLSVILSNTFALEGTSVGRFVTKVVQLLSGDISSATTGRFDTAQKYLYYYFNQDLINILFGGNTVRLSSSYFGEIVYYSHNTYIDFFIRFGAVFAIPMTLFIIYKVIASLKTLFLTKKDSQYFILKALIAIFIFTISLYTEAMYVISFVIFCLLENFSEKHKEEQK